MKIPLTEGDHAMSLNIFVVWNMHIDCENHYFHATPKTSRSITYPFIELSYLFLYSFLYISFELILHSNISPSFCIFCSRTFHYFHMCPPFCADFLFICGFDKLNAVSIDIYYLSLNFENCFEFNLSTLLLHLPFIEWCRFL